MRISRLVVACSVVGALLAAPMAGPAAAVDNCASRYLGAAQRPPAPPSASSIVYFSGGTLHVDTAVVASYATSVSTYYSNITLTYTVCQIIEAQTIARGVTSCISATPGYTNLFTSNPESRYVELVGVNVQVHYGNLLADAQAIVNCT